MSDNEAIRYTVKKYMKLGLSEDIAKQCTLIHLEGELVAAWTTIDRERGIGYPKTKLGGVYHMTKIQEWIAELKEEL
jgi:hypothetical protein